MLLLFFSLCFGKFESFLPKGSGIMTEEEMIDTIWESAEREWNPEIETLNEYRKRKSDEWDKFFAALDKNVEE